jgi:hypothetical protein
VKARVGFISEGFADLVDALETFREKTFHSVFGRCREVELAAGFGLRFKGAEVRFHPGRPDQERGFNFNKIVLIEEGSDFAKHLCPDLVRPTFVI